MQNNTLLEDGQIGIISAGQYRNCFKIGDGVTRWNDLPWVTDYQILFNKPSINGVSLSGNVSLQQLGVASSQNLTAEATARQSADQTLQGNIDAEEEARQSADQTLQDNLDAEEEARQQADTDEATARQSADQTLQGNIDEEEAAREAGDTALAQALAAEATAREEADALKADIDSPHFTGIPTTPDADGSISEQIVNWEILKTQIDVLQTQIDVLSPDFYATLSGNSIITQDGRKLSAKNYD
jgi:hypothetical protein